VALEAMRSGNHAVASAALLQLVRRDPQNVSYRVSRALCQGHLAEKMGDRAEALKHFEHALELDFRCEEAALSLRRLAKSTGLFSRILGKG
jgi:tetratricopeptide (TPR) repeat protein